MSEGGAVRPTGTGSFFSERLSADVRWTLTAALVAASIAVVVLAGSAP